MRMFLFFSIALLSLQQLTSCEMLDAGSYSNAQRYTIAASEQTVINAIDTFKLKHPEMCPSTESKNIDGRRKLSDGTDDYWYHVYFYYPDSKRYIGTWTRADGSNTIFAFISISTTDPNVPWLSINEDLKDSENVAVKKEFEERILNPIKDILNRK